MQSETEIAGAGAEEPGTLAVSVETEREKTLLQTEPETCRWGNRRGTWRCFRRKPCAKRLFCNRTRKSQALGQQSARPGGFRGKRARRDSLAIGYGNSRTQTASEHLGPFRGKIAHRDPHGIEQRDPQTQRRTGAARSWNVPDNAGGGEQAKPRVLLSLFRIPRFARAASGRSMKLFRASCWKIMPPPCRRKAKPI